MSANEGVSGIFDPESWDAVPAFEDLTDLTYHRANDHGTVLIAFDRPDVLNAFDHAMVTRLGECLDQARASGMRAIVLTGAGRAFSSGHDLAEPPLTASEPVGTVHGYLWEIQRLTTRIVEHPAIVIAALNGPAVGMAAELSVAADLRLVSEKAYLLFPEARLALLETNGVTWLLPRGIRESYAGLERWGLFLVVLFIYFVPGVGSLLDSTMRFMLDAIHAIVTLGGAW